LIRITSQVDLAMPVCPYERCDLGNFKSCNTGVMHADSRDFCAAQVRQTTPFLPPAKQLQKIVGMNADIQILGFQY